MRDQLHKCSLVKRSDQTVTVALKALGEPRRVEILRLLQAAPQAVGELASQVDVTQQAVSLHLAVLERAGLVEARKVGTRSVYAVRAAGFRPIEAFVRGFWAPRLKALKDELEKGS